MTFGLKTLLVVVGLVGVAVYLLLVVPAPFATPALIVIAVVLTNLFTAGIVYGGNSLRAFCIGALLPAGATVVALTWVLGLWLLSEDHNFSRMLEYFDKTAFAYRVWIAASWALEGLGGLLTMAVRAAFERRRTRQEPAAPLNLRET